MRIIMTKTKPGSEDGITIRQYKAGTEYDVSESLGEAFIESKSARPAPKGKPTGGDENKSGKGPDEDK